MSGFVSEVIKVSVMTQVEVQNFFFFFTFDLQGKFDYLKKKKSSKYFFRLPEACAEYKLLKCFFSSSALCLVGAAVVQISIRQSEECRFIRIIIPLTVLLKLIVV